VETQFSTVTHVNPHSVSVADGSMDNGDTEITTPDEHQPMRQHKQSRCKPISIKEKSLMANIRTAVMLFVVTIVFLIAFLPAWLMSLGVVEHNAIVFYLYFVYHVANPFIYAFMNKSFRDDLGKVVKCQSMPIVR